MTTQYQYKADIFEEGELETLTIKEAKSDKEAIQIAMEIAKEYDAQLIGVRKEKIVWRNESIIVNNNVIII